MPLLNPYCTVEQVQAELRNTSDTLLTAIEEAINQASRTIDEWTGRDYYVHDYSEAPLVIDCKDDSVMGDVIVLPWPVISIESVTVGGEVWASGTDYCVKGRNSRFLVAYDGDWPVGTPGAGDAIEILGVFGYSQTTPEDVPQGIPKNIERACILLSASFTGHLSKDVVNVDGSVTHVVTKEIPKAVTELLRCRRSVIL